MPATGILSVTVPGAVHAWETLSQRYGRLPLGDVLEPAIRAAEDGFAVSELVAHYWWGIERAGVLDAAARAPLAPGGRRRAPASGSACPRSAARCAPSRRAARAPSTRGAIADAIVAASREAGGFLAPEDLAAHASTWVEPISTRYRGVEVAELPPNGQGLAALLALNVLASSTPRTPRARCTGTGASRP